MRGGTVRVVGGPFGREIQCIEPTLRSQHRFPFLPHIIHQGLQKRFVMVRVRLRADQGAIQSQVNLFDDGVGQIVGDPEFVSSRYVPPIVLFQSQLHGEVAAIQIHMIVQGRNDEFHGVDACGGGLDGHHAIGFDADVGGRHLEYLQTRADDLVGLGVRSLSHVFNVVDVVVVLVSFVWMERFDVLPGFYTILLLVGVVFGTSVASIQTRANVSHWQLTILRIEVVLDHCAWLEGANARGSFSFLSSSSSDSKNVTRFLGLLGKQGTGRLYNSLDVLVGQSFLGAFVDFFLDHLRQFGMYRKGRSGTGTAMTDVGVIDHQVFAFPSELDIRVLSTGVDKFASEDRGGASLLFHVIEGRFHETHAIHNPIQVFEIIDVDFGCPDGVLLDGGRNVLDPTDVQDVISFLDQIVHVDARVRQRHGTQPHLPLTPGQMEGCQ